MSNKAKVTVIPGTSILTIERTFDAPRVKVFKAFTDPELISKWWGMSGSAKIEEHDPQDGGKWRYTEPSPQGDTTFFGIFHEVTAPERIVQTSEWAQLGERGHVAMDRTVFTEKDGKTHMMITEVYFDVETLNAVIQSGMETGLQQSYDHLDKILEELN